MNDDTDHHENDLGQHEFAHPAIDHSPFVLLPNLTATEARQVRDCIRLVIDHDLTAGQNLWPLHTAFAEAVQATRLKQQQRLVSTDAGHQETKVTPMTLPERLHDIRAALHQLEQAGVDMTALQSITLTDGTIVDRHTLDGPQDQPPIELAPGDPWHVSFSPADDERVVHLTVPTKAIVQPVRRHAGTATIVLPALEASKIGSALHAASGLHQAEVAFGPELADDEFLVICGTPYRASTLQAITEQGTLASVVLHHVSETTQPDDTENQSEE